MANGRTITVYGQPARLIGELADGYPTHTEHRIGVAALRVGLRVVQETPELLDRELVAMAREPAQGAAQEGT